MVRAVDPIVMGTVGDSFEQISYFRYISQMVTVGYKISNGS